MTLRALVKDGRVQLDEPTALPEGTVLELVVDDGGDNLDEPEREALHQRLHATVESARQGKVRPSSVALQNLR